jgi:hypothetical protein
MATQDLHNNAENADKFVCELCNFKCSKKSNYDIHCSTRKHQNASKCLQVDCQNNYMFSCENCGNTYKHRQSLYKHKKTCKVIEKEEIEEDEITVSDAKLVFELLKQNNEFKELMLNQTNQIMELVQKCVTTNNINNSNINNGNINNNNYNQFNIQMYLNETCKNAMTIDEFLEYLQPTIQELEDTARLGYIEGITRIIMRGLKDLEEELRPFHCSDLKRETLFIKNSEGEWEKEVDEKPILLKFVKAVGRKNFNNVNEWRKLHPNCKIYDSKSNDMFNQIMLNSTSGRTEEEQKASYEKIIKNITKEVVIDKSKKNKNKVK